MEYASDLDAEGEPATNGSYVTPSSSSPVHPEEPIVGDTVERGEPTEERLDGVRTLIPIEEIEEVPDSELDEVPEENETPLQVREQPPAYSPVRHGQRAMRGGRIPNPYVFRRHCFPYAADSDLGSTPTYSQWSIPPAKCTRTRDDSGDEDGRPVKRARVVDIDDQHESSVRRCWSSSGDTGGSSNGPDARVRASSDRRGVGFPGGCCDASGREGSGC